MPDPSKIHIDTSIFSSPSKPRRGPRKKALLVGIKYTGDFELGSTYADVDNMISLLVDVFHYDTESIVVLQDDDTHTHPTRDNIFKAIDDFICDARNGDRFFFHFSGHGSQRPELVQGSEKDHRDEAIWPSDVDTATLSNIILDNDIRDRLVNRLPKGSRLVITFDCCHSGTAADLIHCHSDHWRPSNLDDVVLRTAALRLFNSPTLEPADTANEELLSPCTALSPSDYKLDESALPVSVVSWAACRDPQKTRSQAGQGGVFTRSFVSVIRTLLTDTSAIPQDTITHEKVLHLVDYSMGAQITWLRRAVHAAKVRSAERLGETPTPFSVISQRIAAPRPQLGSMIDFEKTLHTPLLDVFEFAS